VKICTRCDETKELSEFGKNKAAKDGLSFYCSVCKREYQRKHYAENPDKWSMYGKRWRENNKETKAAYDRTYAENNPERVRAAKQKYKRVHKDRIREQNKIYSLKNKEILREKNRLWRENNLEKHRMKEARRRTRKHQNGVFVVLDKELRKLISSPCYYCGAQHQHIDHLVPISRGGRHSVGNLISSCSNCNLSKNNKFLVEWKASSF
jgi:5-methylcytosine-specific restriction endonuclease McrA